MHTRCKHSYKISNIRRHKKDNILWITTRHNKVIRKANLCITWD